MEGKVKISQLSSSTRLSADDLFIISQKKTSSTEPYVSKRITYSNLSSSVKNDMSVILSNLSSNISSNIEDNYIKKDSGLEGDVVYRTQDSSSGKMTYKDQQIVCQNVFICETEEEFERCKGAAQSFREVFDTWTKFGHFSGKQYGIDADYSGGMTPGYDSWSYNDANKTILESVNSTDFTGFVSVKKHRDYSFTIRCYSTNGDDDFNGVIAAFATDSNGKQHTLSFIRTPNNTNTNTGAITHHWYCALDMDGNDGPFYPTRTSYGQKLIKNSILTKDNEPSGPWSNFKDFGVLIRIERHGNVFKAYTSDFSNTPLTASNLKNEMTIDLDQVINDSSLNLTEQNKAALRLFIDKPVSIGYCTHSQPMSMYENWEMPETNRVLVKMTDKTVWKYSFTEHDWIIDSSKSYIEAAGIGRLSINSVTEKTFYNNGTEIIKVTAAANLDELYRILTGQLHYLDTFV